MPLSLPSLKKKTISETCLRSIAAYYHSLVGKANSALDKLDTPLSLENLLAKKIPAKPVLDRDHYIKLSKLRA